ncbi:hypothetical protein RB195_017827 [Necator americanus]|uniref:Uncharacterized protein n=1 Tax=Necator americanus TaxID=51031 RepID=A0ABR1C8R7_NECAM
MTGDLMWDIGEFDSGMRVEMVVQREGQHELNTISVRVQFSMSHRRNTNGAAFLSRLAYGALFCSRAHKVAMRLNASSETLAGSS